MKKIFLLLGGIAILGLFMNAKTDFEFPERLDFAGEEVPLRIPDVKERMDRELVVNTQMHGSTILILKRANKVFPIIEPILAKYNVPDDFKYLAVIESALVNAVSPAGARGVWQFMPQTAKEKGLEVSETVDERYHLEKSTEAACKYLIAAKDKFGSWTLAAASYNGGMSGLQSQIDFQGVNDYYDLLLNEETSRYVFRIIALKEIMRNPRKYNFIVPESQLYQTIPVKKITVDSTVTDLAKFSKIQGINYKTLKYHNPWLRDKKLDNPTKKNYEIEIPQIN
ncbi:lytic transglycosylase domain-containing protein [Flavobacterium luminosum]|uniref:Lytic transglycosylase domain-containing protein n=1 Tax=Flavobacterium luminosum TaxID=2949086 RepID=A0ABT0TJW1_9FLAO|nr:lytic transglycosylase domain-containing protein [Flavobacterium sp. HXWNR70]MCL9807797.1 lytic transglycosylase domain-containing protein [Flavobacterium sp. HXWNR70]